MKIGIIGGGNTGGNLSYGSRRSAQRDGRIEPIEVGTPESR